MGLTISSKRFSGDMGYFGFLKLRKMIAENIDKDFSIHYNKLFDSSVIFLENNEKQKFFKEYDKKTEEFISKKIISAEVADFLYQSDTDGKITTKQARMIYDLIKNIDDNITIGYIGRNDCLKIKDVKKIFSDKTIVKWY